MVEELEGKELYEWLKEGPKGKDTYYKALIDYAPEIVKDIDNYNQGVIAEKLGIKQSQLSILYNLLKHIKPSIQGQILDIGFWPTRHTSTLSSTFDLFQCTKFNQEVYRVLYRDKETEDIKFSYIIIGKEKLTEVLSDDTYSYEVIIMPPVLK